MICEARKLPASLVGPERPNDITRQKGKKEKKYVEGGKGRGGEGGCVRLEPLVRDGGGEIGEVEGRGGGGS